MIGTFIAGLLIVGQPVQSASPIRTASLFKNGFAMVVREYDLKGDGETIVSPIPQASLGTFWVATSKGVKIQEFVSTNRETVREEPPSNFNELLGAVVGKTVVVTTVNLGNVSGKLLSSHGDLVTMQTSSEMVTFSKGEIRRVSFTDGTEVKVTRTTNERVLRVRTQGAGTMMVYGLERGITWAPAYAIDITDPKSLTLSAKSTVLNDLADFTDVDLKFVTGFPNVPWATIAEPLLSGQSVDQFVAYLQQIGIPDAGFRGRADMSRNVASQSAGFGGFGDSFETSPVPGMQSEDLFFYTQPKVSLKKGDRAFYMLFETKASYEHIYAIKLPDSDGASEPNMRGPQPDMPIDVWHSLKFLNTAKQPLTTAPATVFKDGQIMGQDTLRYTSIGSEALVRMSKALDVRVEENEEEMARERGALKGAYGNLYDLVTVRGTVVVRNPKDEAIKLKIDKQFSGDLVSTDGDPKTSKSAKGLRDVNGRTALLWMPTLGAGKSLTITYTYRLYVPSR
ncbi:MAG: hypothetical protein KF784_02665 [Fimbriimonadaceae bacterium]|nr:hypothetical protein [Fimbriimonadaceae bacterium]